jgi:hypothetical protein
LLFINVGHALRDAFNATDVAFDHDEDDDDDDDKNGVFFGDDNNNNSLVGVAHYDGVKKYFECNKYTNEKNNNTEPESHRIYGSKLMFWYQRAYSLLMQWHILSAAR